MLKRIDADDFNDPAAYAGPAAWENETFRKLSRSRSLAWVVTAVSLLIAFVSVVGILLMAIKLGTTEPAIVLVDRMTGHAERQATVTETMTIPNDEALAISYVVNYVMNRETYDPADNETRIFEVQDLSAEAARESFAWDWDYDNPDHLERVYGQGQVVVNVTSADLLDEDTATVRFKKTYRAKGKKPVTEPFVAVVTFNFVNRPKSISDVWSNPLGFEVTNYRAQRENVGRTG